MSSNKQHNQHSDAEAQYDGLSANGTPSGESNQEIDIDDVAVDDIETPDDDNQVENLEAEVLKLRSELDDEKKKYMFLYADFDNFRKRSLRDKAEIIKNGGEQAFKGLLPIIDDFERGIEAAGKAGGEGSPQVEGFVLIYNKLKKYLEQNGVREFEDADDTFDSDRHEAISAIAAPSEDKKGKILDTVQKGYTINGKVLRHAKVVVGQ